MLEDRNQEDGVTRPLLQGPEGGKPEQPEPQLLQHVQKSHEWIGAGMGCSRWTAVVGSLFVVAVFSIIALILIAVEVKNVLLPPGTKYAMVFDAGSSHTALYIYQWPADKENDTGIVSQVEACTVAGPGISSYINNPSKAGASLKVCLDKAMTVIPANQQRETPTYLGATAGMRLLRELNSTKADQVLAEVSKAIQEYPVDFQGARILTGNEEGSFGWITVNYLLETLIKFSFSGKWVHPYGTEVLGALDLGGASTQITFQPSGTIEDNSTKVFFRLYGTNYSIYTHSYLCYGRDQALKMLLASLSKDNITAQQISHPCYPEGYEMNITTAALYDSPCVLATSTPSKTLTFRGTGVSAECRSSIQKLFNFTAYGAGKMRGFSGVYQPLVHGQFFAFSGFYYTFNFLNLTSGQSFSTVNTTIWEFCAKNWKELQASYPQEKEVHLSNYCASAFYILTLLHGGYGFNEQTWSNIHFRQQAGNTDIGWTLGYVLNLSNMIPTEAPEQVTGHWHSLWAAAVAFIVLTLIVGLVGIALQFLWSSK
ncbi:ectonucleoside triphosphate diphosphohydrolase 8-like isoform X1 [Alligator sinensis]|uniref:Ectonucleoside triphosphate diphosphohydrolase 8 n=2 Tax=Alligator sinensis TaxID=38654 RepID=A0A1U7RZ04_ALLSI|nr:ectonucleoside triphosphate diphosphohydrolase 8-like isoform X1 [Alligator sinensis]